MLLNRFSVYPHPTQMYTVSKAPNHVFSKSRLFGLNTKTVAVEVNKSLATSPSPSHGGSNTKLEIASGPRPVFNPSKRVTSFMRKRQEQEAERNKKENVPDHEEIVNYFNSSWRQLSQRIQKQHLLNKEEVYFTPGNAQLPEFTPCNFERVWADHHYEKLIREIN